MSNPSMETERPDLGLLQRLRLAWFQLLQSIQHLWIRATVLPAPFEDLELDRDKPICYVIDWYETTSLLILDRVCEEQGLPQDLPGELTAFGITEQMKERISGLFRSHPPLEDRIRALQSA